MIKDSMYHTLMCLTEFQEVLQDHNSFFGGKGFGMELNAPNGEVFVSDSHDFPFVRMSGDGKAIGQRRGFHDKRMIAGRDERGGKILEQVRPIVPDGGSLAMHQFGRADDFPPEGLPNALVPEANPEKWFFTRPFEDRGQADARPVGITGAG